VAFATLEHSADALLTDNPLLGQRIIKEKTPITTTDSYLMLSRQIVKQYPTFAETVWDTVRDLRRNEYDQLLGSYLKRR
jgi:hypothetical protein